MATLKKKLFGDVIGRYGDWVGRTRHGKYYIASRPSKYTMSKKPHEVDKRNRFKVNGKFAKAIKSNQLLYKVWIKEKAPATTAYNKTCKVNFSLCGTDRPTINNLITPPGGFYFKITSAEVFDDRIEVDIEPFNILEIEKTVVFMMITSFYDPMNDNPIPFIAKAINNYELDDLKLSFIFSSQEEEIAKHYNKRTIFLAVVTEDTQGNIVRWSGTVARDI
jgi:hypothetical protein